jgi:twinfilin-like protein
MKHTMAIPGLLVHAEDAGVKVDEKIEIHEPGDLDLVEKEKDRKYRSMWRREGYQGTELGYAEMERDKEFWDSV